MQRAEFYMHNCRKRIFLCTYFILAKDKFNRGCSLTKYDQ